MRIFDVGSVEESGVATAKSRTAQSALLTDGGLGRSRPVTPGMTAVFSGRDSDTTTTTTDSIHYV